LTSPDGDGFLLSPHGTPHNARFIDAMTANAGDMAAFDYMGLSLKKNQAAFAATNNANNMGQDFELFAVGGSDRALSTPTFMTFPEASPCGSVQGGWISEGEGMARGGSRRTSRRISNGILDKVAKFEAMGGGVEGGERPTTPPNQNAPSTLTLHISRSEGERK
jgi:regulatory protein SWI5